MTTTSSSAPPTPAVRATQWWSICVSGDLDVATGPDLEARLGRASVLHGDDGIVLDLAGIEFIDCAGLRPILRARNRLPDRFCLCGLPPRVLRLLELTALTPTLRILPGATRWPIEADPQGCHILLDDLHDRRPARHVTRQAPRLGQARSPVPDPR
jgi:anti-sigma B factor antagonist